MVTQNAKLQIHPSFQRSTMVLHCPYNPLHNTQIYIIRQDNKVTKVYSKRIS